MRRKVKSGIMLSMPVATRHIHVGVSSGQESWCPVTVKVSVQCHEEVLSWSDHAARVEIKRTLRVTQWKRMSWWQFRSIVMFNGIFWLLGIALEQSFSCCRNKVFEHEMEYFYGS